jgi:prepilin-type processing-associated H-X9-DG protein
MERRQWLVLFGAALGQACQVFRSADATQCSACKRPIHAHSKTVAFADGHSRVFCCPACALSEHGQTGKPVTITRLTSYLTGEPLPPESAYVVKGSDVNMCILTQDIVNADKRPADLRYDRCAPSIYAFARQTEAAGFAKEHGGEVMRFPQAVAVLTR